MAKIIKLTILSFLLFGCANNNQKAALKYERIGGPESTKAIYALSFYKQEKLVAKRKYRGGKIIENFGTIPKDISNVLVIKAVRKNNGENRKQGVLFLKDGKVIAKRMFVNGNSINKGKISDGIVIELYDDGRIRNLFIYKNGKRNGPALGLYQNQKMKAEGYYRDDCPIGVGKTYHENRKLKAEWKIEAGVEKYHIEYDKNGKLIEKK